MLNITNLSGRSIGYACSGKTVVIEAGETKPVPLAKDDPRIAGDLHAGVIKISDAAIPAKPAPLPNAPQLAKGQ
jgi:hypothetical protein